MTAQNKTEPLLPVYLICGEDELKRDAVLKRLYARIEALGDLSFNADTFSGETATGDEIVAACNTIPFASDIRLVDVRMADKLGKADAEAVASYLSFPCETTVLALVAEKMAKNSKLYKAVVSVDSRAIVDCAPQKRRELTRTVRSLAKAQGVEFTERAAAKLIELVGENTVRLDSEVKKIALAHVGTASIDDRDVEHLVVRTSEVKPWQFLDALSARDVRCCLEYWKTMFSVSPYAMIALCTTRIRELICAKALTARGNGTTRSLASALGIQEWRVKNHFSWACGYSMQELRRALSLAREAERKMKSGSDPNETFLLWVLQVTATEKAG